MARLKLSFINGKGEWLSTHAQTFDCDSTRGLLEGLRAVLRALTDEDARLYLKARKSPQKSFLGAS